MQNVTNGRSVPRPSRREFNALLGGLGAALAAPRTFAQSNPHFVYVESNIGLPDQNSIFAFRRDRDGNLAPVSGSPFLTAGRGIVDPTLRLGPFDSDQNIVRSSDRTLLFAVNSGSNTIAVFHIGSDGALTPVEGSPFPSGGRNPVSLGLHENYLIVVNKNQDPQQGYEGTVPNYTVMSVAGNGSLTPVPDSTIPLDALSSPSQALISPLGPHLFDANFLGGLLQSLTIGADGTLMQNPPQMLPAAVFKGVDQPRAPLGLWAHPRKRILYVGFVTIAKLAVYSYDSKGILCFERAVPNSGIALCWIRVNSEGTQLYTANTGDNSISVYDLSDPLKPDEIQKLTLRRPGNVFQIEFDRDEQYLYAVSQRADTRTPRGDGSYLHVLSIGARGVLTEVPSSPVALPVPPDHRPQGLATV